MIWYDLIWSDGYFHEKWVWVSSHLSFEHGGPGICVLRRTLCDARCPLVRCLQGQTLEMKIMNGTSAKFPIYKIYMMKSNIIKIWHVKKWWYLLGHLGNWANTIQFWLIYTFLYISSKKNTKRLAHLEILQISAHLAANEAGAAGRYPHAIRSILRCWPLCISHFPIVPPVPIELLEINSW